MDCKVNNFFTDDQRVKLISLIKKHPFLYDKTHVVYNKKMLREKAWREISKQVNADENVCRQSWRSMRDQYYRSVYQMRKFGDPNKRYKHFHLLQFLGETPQPRGRKCHIDYELEKREMQKELWMLDSTNDGFDDSNTNTSQISIKPDFSEAVLSENSMPCINLPDSIPINKQHEEIPCNIGTENPVQSQETVRNVLPQRRSYNKLDKYDHFFLSISATVRDYGLSLTKFAELQCSIIKCITTELEKFNEEL